MNLQFISKVVLFIVVCQHIQVQGVPETPDFVMFKSMEYYQEGYFTPVPGTYSFGVEILDSIADHIVVTGTPTLSFADARPNQAILEHPTAAGTFSFNQDFNTITELDAVYPDTTSSPFYSVNINAEPPADLLLEANAGANVDNGKFPTIEPRLLEVRANNSALVDFSSHADFTGFGASQGLILDPADSHTFELEFASGMDNDGRNFVGFLLYDEAQDHDVIIDAYTPDTTQFNLAANTLNPGQIYGASFLFFHTVYETNDFFNGALGKTGYTKETEVLIKTIPEPSVYLLFAGGLLVVCLYFAKTQKNRQSTAASNEL